MDLCLEIRATDLCSFLLWTAHPTAWNLSCLRAATVVQADKDRIAFQGKYSR